MLPLPLVVDIGGSRQLRILLAALHIAGAVALFLAELPTLLHWSGVVLLGASLAIYQRPARRHRLKGDQDGKLHVWLAGQWQAVDLSSSSLIWPGFISLRYVVTGQRRRNNLLVLPDSMAAAEFRRLRVWLRWRGSRMEAASSALHTSNQ